MKPPKDNPVRILTPQRSIVAQALMDRDHPITAPELCAEIDELRMSELLEHLRVLCAAGIVSEPVARHFEISTFGARLLHLQSRIEQATTKPHL